MIRKDKGKDYRDDMKAYLGAGTSYTGKLNFVGAVYIGGEFTGEITSDGTLEVGQGSVTRGTIYVRQLILSGLIEGDVVVTEKAVLHSTAQLKGTLITKALVMEEGAFLQGSIKMEPELIVAPEKEKVQREPLVEAQTAAEPVASYQ